MKNIKHSTQFKKGSLKTKVVIATAIMGILLISVGGIDNVNFNNTTHSVDQHIQVFGSAYKTQYGVITASTLSVRSGAGSNFSSVASLKKGTNITILGKTNNYYKITYGGKSRYISAQYVKITPKPVAKPVVSPIVKPASSEPSDIAAIRKTCVVMGGMSNGISRLIPVKVTNIKLGEAKVTGASKGYTQEQLDVFNLGLADGVKLYAYWLKTGHDYDIFGNGSKENVKNDWDVHMIEAANLLHEVGINTPETDAMVSEFQFIAQEIINYMPYAIKAEGCKTYLQWTGLNSYQSIGAEMAGHSMAALRDWFYGAK